MNRLYNKDPYEMASRYRDMKVYGPNMYRESIYQYSDMARGGNGGILHGMSITNSEWAEHCVSHMMPVDSPITCRAYNYPGYPDSFFQQVLEMLGEMD